MTRSEDSMLKKHTSYADKLDGSRPSNPNDMITCLLEAASGEEFSTATRRRGNPGSTCSLGYSFRFLHHLQLWEG
jgi:hypothetical protein